MGLIVNAQTFSFLCLCRWLDEQKKLANVAPDSPV